MFALLLLDTLVTFGVLGKGIPRKRNILTYGMQYNQDTLSSPFMRFLFPNKNRIMQESHKWRKNINNILYTMILTKNRIM